MDWNPAYAWLAIALLLGLAKLSFGTLTLLALGLAAILTSGLAFLGLSLLWQLLGFTAFSGILVALTIKVIQPYFSLSVSETTDSTETGKEQKYKTRKRMHDGATVIEIDGDDYCIRVERTSSTQLPAGSWVIFQKFEGDIAIVTLPPPSW